jgi:hypothetical protein
MRKPILWSAALCAAACYPALADEWSKTFKAGAKPELHVTTNDGNVTVRAASVTNIEARVLTSGWKIGPGDVRITEQQSGDRVELDVKVPAMHFNLGNRWVKIELEVPAATAADIHTSDGNIRSDGLRGGTRLVTHDGNIEGESFDGTLEASSGDGNIRVRGRFDALNLRSGDGNIDAEVRPGSRMAGAWTLHSGDGRVSLRLPESFAADLEAHTGDGHITVDLPLTTSGGIRENTVSGKLSGGGPTLTIHTGDGSIHVAGL